MTDLRADELVKLADKVRDWMPSRRDLLTFIAHERRLIETALRRLAEAGTQAVPVAWQYELADGREWSNGKPGEYVGWHWRLSREKPNVPEGSIRNLTPLYTAPPAPSVAVKVKPLEWREHVPHHHDAVAVGARYQILHIDGDWVLFSGAIPPGSRFSTLADAKAAAQADYEARIKSARVDVPEVKGEPEPVADWRDDPTSDERWNAGCDFAMTQLCKALDVDPAAVNWDAATETVDGDVQSVIWNILRARMGEDWDPATAPPADAGMREALTYAESLAVVLWSKHFKDIAPHWKPLTGDLIGLLTQIDNMTAALTSPGATTKSDGGVEGHAPMLAHGGECLQAPAASPAGIKPGPSDPSVTVERGIYIASKTKHAGRWKRLRSEGVPIISTWIDEAGTGETSDFHDLWHRCLTESANCAVLVSYREPGEVLKGGWVEIGAALAKGVPVYAVGLEEFTIAGYRGITHFPTIEAAIEAARALLDQFKMIRRK